MDSLGFRKELISLKSEVCKKSVLDLELIYHFNDPGQFFGRQITQRHQHKRGRISASTGNLDQAVFQDRILDGKERVPCIAAVEGEVCDLCKREQITKLKVA